MVQWLRPHAPRAGGVGLILGRGTRSHMPRIRAHMPQPKIPPCCLVAQPSLDSLSPHGLQPPRLLCPWDFPGKNSGAGCHFLLQGIFPTQRANLGLLHRRQILYHLNHQGNQATMGIHYFFPLFFNPKGSTLL